MTQITNELASLRQAELNPKSVRSAELLAEELAAHVARSLGTGHSYMWDSEKLIALIERPSGVALKLKSDESRREVIAHIDWLSRGNAQYSSVKRNLKTSADAAVARLTGSGWHVQANPQYSRDSVSFDIVASVDSIALSISQYASSLCKALDLLNTLS